MNIGEGMVSLAGRTLSIEPTSGLAQAAIAPALAHLAADPGVGGKQTRWTIIEEDESWRPYGFDGAGAYRTPKPAEVAIVQTNPASLELYTPRNWDRVAGDTIGAGGGRFARPSSVSRSCGMARRSLNSGSACCCGLV